MSPDFFFSNFNLIALVVWSVFFVLVVVRFVRPHLLRHISYGWLVCVAVSLHLLYGIFATWGQYIVWSKNEFTKVFLSSSLSLDVPFPSLLEWTRPLFSGTHGYFAFYSFQHFFLSSIALFFITGLFVLFLKTYALYKSKSLGEGEMTVIALAFLIAGWAGAMILVPISFAIAILFIAFNKAFNNTNRVQLSTSFLVASPLALIFAAPILTLLNLYQLLKI